MTEIMYITAYSKMVFVLALVSLFFVISINAKPTWKDLDNYTFDEFVKDFNFDYSPKEIENRRQLFLNELARVREHNKKNLSWKEGINQFSALTAAEKKVSLGRSKSVAAATKDLKHVKSLPNDFVVRPVNELPKSS
jgi:hypothetical protein